MSEPEIVEPLSQDEETVLLILAQGECLAPIGRWEKPLKSLATRGFAVAHNESNYGATEAGKALAERKDDQFFRGWIEGSNRAVERKQRAVSGASRFTLNDRMVLAQLIRRRFGDESGVSLDTALSFAEEWLKELDRHAAP